MRRFLCLAAAAAILMGQTPRYDIVITGARVMDGSGSSWYYGDIGIQGDTIASIGQLAASTATVKIDGKGMVVAPGFIDIHSHGRRGIGATPTAENYLREGVTTIVEGPDGSSPIPIKDFLDGIGKTPISVNFATFIGQGSIREKVIGSVNRKATADEIARMKEIAAQGMRDGAFGLSTGLFYVPGNFTPTEEVIELAKVVGRMGGIHISHMREEASHVLDSVQETIRIGEEGGLPTQITHHKTIGQASWGKSVESLRLVEEARARGVDVTIDQYPYTASSTGVQALIPQWALEGGRQAVGERLKAPEQRARIKATIVENLKYDRGAGDPKNVAIVSCGFDASLAGKNIAEITKARGAEVTMENAAETVMDLVAKGGCSAVYHAIAEEDVVRIMRSPYTMVASDGDIPRFGEAAPHPRSYGTFARVLGVYVREKQVISLEEAVRKMSGYPAERLKIFDRGILRPGMKADVVVFDPATVADRATYEKPHQYSVGMRAVIVNGKLALYQDKVTAERPGRVIYGPSHVN